MRQLSGEQMAAHLISRERGAHDLMIYDRLDTFRTVYSTYCKTSLPRQDEIVVIISNYENLKGVMNTLAARIGPQTNLLEYEKDGSLVIIDSVKAYQIDPDGAYKLGLSLVLRAQRENKAGVTVLADLGSYFLCDKLFEVIRHETALPSKYEKGLRGYCFYHKEDFGRLDKEQQNLLNEHHQETAQVSCN